MALFTFGEGYHNYHRQFQHDYRNGVKPWQWDPTKWLIWILSKLGLTSGLRRVPEEATDSARAGRKGRWVISFGEKGNLSYLAIHQAVRDSRRLNKERTTCSRSASRRSFRSSRLVSV
jgi:hypothetical protein